MFGIALGNKAFKAKNSFLEKNIIFKLFPKVRFGHF
jgi:hypothetical protein